MSFDADSFMASFTGDVTKARDLCDALRAVYEMGKLDGGLKEVDFLIRLRAVNLSRVVRFGHGDIKAPHGWGPMQWGCALAGEVGELCNFLKKYQRQMPSDPSPDMLLSDIGKEIADVFIYLDLLASTFDFDLQRVITSKFNATSKKFGFPERL